MAKAEINSMKRIRKEEDPQTAVFFNNCYQDDADKRNKKT